MPLINIRVPLFEKEKIEFVSSILNIPLHNYITIEKEVIVIVKLLNHL